MQMHLILALNGPESIETLEANIDRLYRERSKKLGNRSAWIVAEDDTAQAVSEKLGINSGEGGISAIVTTISNYFGRAEPELWAWIKVQWESSPDGSADQNRAA